MKEENPEKKSGFAHVIAHYMKLAYSTWHKELVHDDSIQSELSTMTQGELEFNNRPFVKHRVDNRGDRDDYASGGGKYRKNFGPRNNNRNNQGRDNRNNNRNNKFKKRY